MGPLHPARATRKRRPKGCFLVWLQEQDRDRNLLLLADELIDGAHAYGWLPWLRKKGASTETVALVRKAYARFEREDGIPCCSTPSKSLTTSRERTAARRHTRRRSSSCSL